MKTKIFAGIMALALGFSAVSCSDDDDYSPASGEVVQSIVTGSSDVTATSAKLNGTVKGLGSLSASSYAVGFYYGNSAEALTKTVDGTLDGEAISAEISGLTANTTLYYQAYVTLQKTVTYKGEVKSLITTDAKVVTTDASNVDVFSATIGGTSTDAPSTATAGVVLAASSDVEAVRAGLRVSSDDVTSISVTKEGLLPGATYYYAAYLDLGTGVVYGDVKEFETKEYSFDVNDLFVDLGLSTKWAKCNIGAAEPEDFGGLFAFGDMTGLNPSKDIADYTVTSDVYKTANDIAYKVYDGKATMPSADEFEELIQKCTSEWTEVNGVAGCKFTGPNGNSIFLPAAGSRKGHTISGEGSEGLYLTGSVNASSSDFAVSYDFSNGVSAKSTTPRFQALSVRAVTVAKDVKLDELLLNNTWEFDLAEDGSYTTFPGPVYFYGSDDSWATITNNEPTIDGNHWSWAADYAGNPWVVESKTSNAKGKMTFSVDESGNNVVTVVRYDTTGVMTTQTGTYTVDVENKTISLVDNDGEPLDILYLANMAGKIPNAATDVRILSISEETLQLGVFRNDGQLLGFNYVTSLKKYGFNVKLTCYSFVDKCDDEWSSAVIKIPADPNKVCGDYSITFTTTNARTQGDVYVLDVEGFATAFPNALVRINKITADGKDVPFDANKFYYGDTEGKGNYRVELANIWGCGHNSDYSGLADSPFRKNGGEVKGETALAFNSTFKVDFTVASVTSDGTGTYPVNFVTVDFNWQSSWGTKTGTSLKVTKENFKYVMEATEINMTYDGSDAPSADFSKGSLMTFFQVEDIYAYFPTMHATLDAISIDGTALTYDKTKVLDSNESPKYRLELWNPYGATASDCAFGTPTNNVIKELGFNEKMELTATFHSLFAVPSFE